MFKKVIIILAIWTIFSIDLPSPYDKQWHNFNETQVKSENQVA